MSSPEEPSVLIVGAGVFGASTAYHLSLQYRDASKITVVDRTTAPPTLAASTDINKIIRADYSSAFYAELAYEAMDAWSQWPELKDHYHRTGWIMLDAEDSDLSDRIRKVFRDRGHDPTEDVPLRELDDHWKGIMKGTATEGFKAAYWNPEAGWCQAAAATASMMNAAISRGVKYVVGEVEELLLESGKVSGIRTSRGQAVTADKVVLATGAWTSSTLSPMEDKLHIAEKDRVERQATAAAVGVVHYKMSAAEMEKLSEMPVVVYGEHGEVIPPPKENNLLKYTNANTFTSMTTTPSGHKISVPPRRDQHIVPEALKRETEAVMSSRVMPTFAQGKTPEYWRLCWDARTPTQDWLLTQHPHPQLSNLYLATGGSFHSYKFLPIIGKYVVNVLSGKGNGGEKDQAWGWKSTDVQWRGAHEQTEPKRDLRDLEASKTELQSKL
ncbi:L-pipecolate oxidase [Lecanosticta acicola]|uniref:L-pipecolate oxidase n=1 Tax=Lecanosticta acicola TaxID=111012 RepID=A0AAI8Z2Z1_9PEZI|nr:L-pipecolate oxidase [Lecanosticta acicola]